MRTELVNLLESYLLGWKTLSDIADWLAGIDWDDPGLDPQSQKIAGRMELLVTEVAEGLRPETEFWRDAQDLVSRETHPSSRQSCLYSTEALLKDSRVVSSSNDGTLQLPFTVQVGQESQPLNRSPLPVSA